MCWDRVHTYVHMYVYVCTVYVYTEEKTNRKKYNASKINKVGTALKLMSH